MGANEKHEAAYHGTTYTPTSGDIREVWVAMQSDPWTRSTANAEFDRWLAGVNAEAKAEALTEVAEHLENHPTLRKTQFAWLYYPEAMAAKEKEFRHCAAIVRDRAAQIRKEIDTE